MGTVTTTVTRFGQTEYAEASFGVSNLPTVAP